MDKSEILFEIKRLTEENDGKAPGFQRFSSETGLRKSEWYPNLWLRWGDAINEAGCTPNTFNTAYDEIYLIEKYVKLIRELGHFPLEGELRVRERLMKIFPVTADFHSLGKNKIELKKS